MKKFCGGSDFKTLYYNFVTRDTSGKLFLMEEYRTESINIGAGVTIFIEKATSFLLNILKDWQNKKPHVLIGDITLFTETLEKRQKRNIKDKIKKAKKKFEKTHRIAIQLHNILREQQKLKKNTVKQKQNR